MLFKVLSYNIHKAIGIDRRFAPDRIAAVLKHHQADVVLLQEVDVGVPRSNMLNLAEELAELAGYPHHALGLNVKLRTGHYGNATLSRFPIIRQSNIDLTIGRKKRRGCQHTTIALDDGVREHPFEVFNLHLGLSASERSQQVGLLYRAEQFVSMEENRLCLVGGDFNDWGNYLTPIFTEILGFQCATSRGNDNQSTLRTYPSISPTGKLDKIFLRGQANVIGSRTCRLQVSRLASDHLPVIVQFELRNGQRRRPHSTGS